MGQKKQKGSVQAFQADISTGAQWLNQLSEPDFRDQILKDLFSRMKADGAIVDFLYTHGRNEHGVDWLVLERGNLLDRFVGIQAKSKPITVQGDSRSDSALKIKLQCESAFDHQFTWRGNNIRLDAVQLWTSAHITADAEAELTAPISRHKIPVLKAENVFAHIDKFCPSIISKIPGLAEASYIRRMANPDPLSTRLLGIQLNPKKHFIEPRFSRYSELSPSRVFDQRANKMREEPPLYLEKIIQLGGHALIIGGELCGKTYLLKRISCNVAELGHVPVFLDGSVIKDKIPKTIPQLLVKYLPWYPLSLLQSPAGINRTIYLLIDNIDGITTDEIDSLCSSAHSKIVVMMTSKRYKKITGFSTYYMSGVRSDAVPKFVRSLDVDHSAISALTDRATQYINRAFGTSGLPVNPFTVSVMLAECRVAQRRLATPTMGRLIERFVEGQLGSHADSLKVDFETKNQFLNALGGANLLSLKTEVFRRKLAKCIANHGHPHGLSAFEQDLIESGLLEYSQDGEFINWTRPVFRDFFWVRNLVREKKFKVLSNHLIRRGGVGIAAITGSQMGNANCILNDLLANFENLDWMGKPKRKLSLGPKVFPEDMLPSDADEEKLLSEVEKAAEGPDVNPDAAEFARPPKEDRVPSTSDEGTDAVLSQYIKNMIEEKHYLVGNVAALLVNARALSRADKEKAAICVIRSNQRMVQHFTEMIKSSLKGKVPPIFAETIPRFWGMLISDTMIGDSFLIDIFRGLERTPLSNAELLALTDLLVASGGESPDKYEKTLSRNSDVADVLAIYFRLVYTYYFRFHKEADRKLIRDAMKSLRKRVRGFTLPPVT